MTGEDSFDNWKNNLEDSLVVDGQIDLIEAKRVLDSDMESNASLCFMAQNSDVKRVIWWLDKYASTHIAEIKMCLWKRY